MPLDAPPLPGAPPRPPRDAAGRAAGAAALPTALGGAPEGPDVDAAIGRTRVLAVDGVRPARQAMRGQLLELGFPEVVEAGTAQEALRRMADGPFGLVVCEDDLSPGGDATTGAQLLEHARTAGRLPGWALFVLCAAESARERVAVTLECPPDDYLIKPLTTERLAARLRRVFERRLVFEPAQRRVAVKNFAQAVVECDRIADEHPRWRIDAWRIKAHALLDLGRVAEADAVFAQVLAERDDAAWARVGRGRAALLAGRLDEAEAFAGEALRSAEARPGAFDVLAAVGEARGDPAAVQALLQRATRAIPSARRRRALAHAAWRAGDVATAKHELDRVLRATRGTLAERPDDATQLAQILVDGGEAARAIALLAEADRAPRSSGAHAPDAVLARMSVLAQAHVRNGSPALAHRAMVTAREALARVDAPSGAPGARAASATARLHLARAHLACSAEREGLAALGDAIRADHENAALAGLARRMMAGTGHEAAAERVIGESVRRMGEAIEAADALMRAARYDESIATLNEALRDVPDNTALLVAATRLHLLWLRQKGLERDRVDRIRGYLDRLDALAPGAPEVLRLHRFFRETLNRGQAAVAPDPAAPSSGSG